MSVVVVYDGKKKPIKIAGPNVLIQDLVREAAESFSLDPAKCSFSHKRTSIPGSQLFRFSNIPNNGTVDLVYDERLRGGAPAKVAIALQDGGSIVKSFASSLSLLDVLDRLVADGDIPQQVLQLSPELIYMRNSYSGVGLASTSLAQLGLAG
jgi:hypothetical protein